MAECDHLWVSGGMRADFICEHCGDTAEIEADDERDEREVRRDHLVEGFVGNDPARQRLYHTSATFRQAIETLVQMVPAWVDGLAAHAESEETRMVEAMHKMARESLDIELYGHRLRLPGRDS